MQITFLGTASGAPSRQRNVSATGIALEEKKAWALVDCGEATQHQLLYSHLSPQKLSVILITHKHGDHCYGLPGLLASCQLNGRTEPLTLVAPEEVWRYLQAVIELTDLYITYPLDFIPVSESLQLERAGFTITATQLSHRVPSWAYRFQETRVPLRLDQPKLRAHGITPGSHWGQLQAGQDVILADGRILKSAEYTFASWRPRVAVIAGDNDCPELLTDACRDADLLVHEATYTQPVLERVGPEPQHSSALMVAGFAQKIALPNLLLTHFSPRYLKEPRKPRDLSIQELRSEARSVYSGRLKLAEDFEVYEVNRKGELGYLRHLRRDGKRAQTRQQQSHNRPEQG